MSTDLALSSLVDVAGQIAARRLSSREVVQAVLDRADRIAPALNCFITVDGDAALAEADRLDRLLVAGAPVGPLHGIPVSIKDTFPTAGMKTTAGSPILADWVPPSDAAAVATLRRAGAIVIAKASAYQFAFGSAHPAFGEVRNPWDLDRCCGGSSSGSAAAVAAGLGYGSLGSDAAGSVRAPGALCGVVAMKPTHDLISVEGALPAAWSMDHAGLFGRQVADVHQQLRAVPGYRAKAPERLEAASLKGLRVGVPRRHPGDTDIAITPEVQQLHDRAIDLFVRAGASVREVDLPRLDESQLLMMLIFAGELNEFHLPWYQSCPELYSGDVVALMEGSQALPAVAYVRAQRIRETLKRRYLAAMADLDVLATPVMPVPAWPVDRAQVRIGAAEVSALTAQTWHCVPFNLTGQPALSVPAGLVGGLPAGIQLVGSLHADAALLGVARAFEQERGPIGAPAISMPHSERKEAVA